MKTMTWEYAISEVKGLDSSDKMSAELNKMGSQGWELSTDIVVFRGARAFHILIFKKPSGYLNDVVE